MSLTDTRRFWLELRNAGEKGVHSWDCYGWTRNAPQRAKDCVDKGQRIYKRTERRNNRPGTRYWLHPFQPQDALPVRPNGPEGGSGEASVQPSAAPLSVEAASEQVGIKQPTAIVLDWDGVWRELPWDEERREAA